MTTMEKSLALLTQILVTVMKKIRLSPLIKFLGIRNMPYFALDIFYVMQNINITYKKILVI